MSDHPRPSPAAGDLVRGGYDPHVHIAPDVMERRIDGLALMADRFLAAGFTEEQVHTMAVTNTVALAGSTS